MIWYVDGLSLHQRGLGGMSGVLLLKELYKRYEVTSDGQGGQGESQDIDSQHSYATAIVPWFLSGGERAIAKRYCFVVQCLFSLLFMRLC